MVVANSLFYLLKRDYVQHCHISEKLGDLIMVVANSLFYLLKRDYVQHCHISERLVLGSGVSCEKHVEGHDLGIRILHLYPMNPSTLGKRIPHSSPQVLRSLNAWSPNPHHLQNLLSHVKKPIGL